MVGSPIRRARKIAISKARREAEAEARKVAYEKGIQRGSRPLGRTKMKRLGLVPHVEPDPIEPPPPPPPEQPTTLSPVEKILMKQYELLDRATELALREHVATLEETLSPDDKHYLRKRAIRTSAAESILRIQMRVDSSALKGKKTDGTDELYARIRKQRRG